MNNPLLPFKCFILLSAIVVCYATAAFSKDRISSDLTWQMEVTQTGRPSGLAAALVFRNTGKTSLPADGWKICFNSIRSPAIGKEDSGRYAIRQLNGDLYELSPAKAFAGLPAGGVLRIHIEQKDLKNISDFPSGFYLVWDQDPGKGYKIPNADPEFRQVLLFEPEVLRKIFTKNEQIKEVSPQKQVKIFPTPLEYREKGFSFIMTPEVKIINAGDFANEARLLSDYMGQLFGTSPLAATAGTGKAVILQKTDLAAGAYHLDITKDKILIGASSAAGIFYGIQSLKTLLPSSAMKGKQQQIGIPAVEAEDAPRFAYRSFMLDVARNFQTKQEVMKILDVMALYKLNVLHLHFSDDEGWRIEIPGLPELTENGSVRGHTLTSKRHLPPSYGSGPDTHVLPGSGHYSRSDFISILRYAAARHISVIPEIETPGHARAAIKAMDIRYEKYAALGQKDEAERYLLSDRNDHSVYRSVQGWTDNVINPAVPSVYRFIEKVVNELVLMYREAGAPLHTIHMGGDEVPAGVWERSEAVNKLIAADTLVKSPDDVWKYYFTKVSRILQSHDLYMSGWEEIGLKKVLVNGKKKMEVDPSLVHLGFQTDVWNNLVGTGAEDLAYRLANAGYKVVLSNVSNMYLDFAINKSFSEPGMYWGGYVDTDKPFYFTPFDSFRNFNEDDQGNPVDQAFFRNKVRLSEAGRSNIVGLQAALWTETITNSRRLEYMLLPKLLSLAERAWSKDPSWTGEQDSLSYGSMYRDAWSAYLAVLWERELPRLDHYSGGWAYRIPAPGVIIKDGKIWANTESRRLIIKYTTDGSEPQWSSRSYTGPFKAGGVVHLKVFNSEGKSGRTVKISMDDSKTGL